MPIAKKTVVTAAVLVVLIAGVAWFLNKPATARLAAPTAIPVRVVSVLSLIHI